MTALLVKMSSSPKNTKMIQLIGSKKVSLSYKGL